MQENGKTDGGTDLENRLTGRPGDPRPGAGRRKPEWLRIQPKAGKNYSFLKGLMRSEGLHTVCEEARCPNLSECWGRYRTASFMVLGDTCTRRCRFCAVKTGLPGLVDRLEPLRVAEAVKRMGLRHVHVTMVNRDDLPDGGAGIMAATIRAVRGRAPGCSIEVLCSDFQGDREALAEVVGAGPDIFSHNVETVRRLTPFVRSRSEYDRSLEVLRMAKEIDPRGTTKSSIMLGLGESFEEILEVMDDLRALEVDMLNIGQYLQPSHSHASVKRYWHPDEFAELKRRAMQRGFLHCEAGPLVRSSYHADEQFKGYLRRRRDSPAAT
jgi:lipoic acid synthetase